MFQTDMVEEYFHMSSDKAVTSDRTLAKLSTPRMDARSLMQLMSDVPSMYTRERVQLYHQYSQFFSKWMFLMWSVNQMSHHVINLTITLQKCTLLSTGFYGIIQNKVPHFFNAIFVIFQFTNP